MKLRTLLRLGRVSNLPTTFTNVAAGIALSGGQASLEAFGGLCAAIALLYVGGMYLNDAFDAEHDAEVRAERPIPSGEISARAVFTLGFVLLALGVALVFFVRQGPGLLAPAAALVLAAVIVFYDAYHKQNPFSPVVMAANRVLVYVTAALAVNGTLSPRFAWGSANLACYLVGLTYAAKQENLREPRGFWPLAFVAAPFAFAPAFGSALGTALYAALALWTAHSLVFLLDRQRRNVKRAVSQLIAGICLLDAMLVASQGHALAAAACALGLLATLLAQRFVPGT